MRKTAIKFANIYNLGDHTKPYKLIVYQIVFEKLFSKTIRFNKKSPPTRG